MYNISLAMAVLPVVLLGLFIYLKDNNKEPFPLLAKIFLLGVVMAIPVVIAEIIFDVFFNTDDVSSFIIIFIFVFLSVGIIEEGAKFIVTKFIGYDDKEFDEIYDIIVYSAFASLGFACIENILYVFNYGLGVAITRALLSVPGHLCFGVLMGYFLAMAKINSINNNKSLYYRNMILSLLVPTLVHTMYDALIIYAENMESTIAFFLFIIFDINMVIVCFITVNMVSKMQVGIKKNYIPNRVINNKVQVPNAGHAGQQNVQHVQQNSQAVQKNQYIQQNLQPVQQSIIYCPICGKYTGDDIFCGRCGYKLK